MDSKLRQLQLYEIEILDEFVRICEKHSLQYYLVGGTLLGAIRHQGFIPWDDDIDVAMPREDYDRFAEISASELDPQYFYQCPETDPYYFLTYAKIRKYGTEIYEERFKDARFHKGVFIDIIPLDICPKPGLICHFIFNILAVMNYRGQVDSGEEYRPYREISGRIGYFCLRIFNKRQLITVRKKLICLSSLWKDSNFWASYSGAYGYYKEVFPNSWYGTGNNIMFEGKKYRAPIKTREQLIQVYGKNYMTIPDQAEQRWHCDLERSKLS